MNRARQLYELQEVDLEIDSKRAKLTEVQSRMGESEALNQARDSLARQEEQLSELERSQRDCEREVEDLKSKASISEDKLYGGKVKNPKELESLQEQLKIHQRKIKEIDDKTLDIMEGIEALKQGVASQLAEVERLEQQWHAEQASLSKEQDELNVALDDLEKKRDELASKVDAAVLELYQALRLKRQGRAVAKVQQGICQGCRITLPITDLQRVKTGQNLVQCNSCERILYLS